MTYILTLDLGGTFIKHALATAEGDLSDKGRIKTPDTLEGVMDVIEARVCRSSDRSISGIAVSSPGSVAEDGVIYGGSAIPYIHGPNIKQMIQERTGLRVQIENDANCAGLAEVWQGSARNQQDVAVVVIGTGIGGALIKNGDIHHGGRLHGGEFGYMILDPNNLGSGMSSFSETASSYSIIKRVAAKKGFDPASITGEEIFQQAERGDQVCQQAIADFHRMLAIGLYNIQYIYDPDVILIGGGISKRHDLIDRLKDELETIVNKIDVATIVPVIDRCHFHADANLIGAVYHFLQKEPEWMSL